MFDIEKMKEGANQSKRVIGWRVIWKKPMCWGQEQWEFSRQGRDRMSTKCVCGMVVVGRVELRK